MIPAKYRLNPRAALHNSVADFLATGKRKGSVNILGKDYSIERKSYKDKAASMIDKVNMYNAADGSCTIHIDRDNNNILLITP